MSIVHGVAVIIACVVLIVQEVCCIVEVCRFLNYGRMAMFFDAGLRGFWQ